MRLLECLVEPQERAWLATRPPGHRETTSKSVQGDGNDKMPIYDGLIAIKLCALSEMHAKVRKESLAGYATYETLVCGPQDHTIWRQIYSGHMQGLLYRFVLNSCLPPPNGIFAVAFRMCGPPNFRYVRLRFALRLQVGVVCSYCLSMLKLWR